MKSHDASIFGSEQSLFEGSTQTYLILDNQMK